MTFKVYKFFVVIQQKFWQCIKLNVEDCRGLVINSLNKQLSVINGIRINGDQCLLGCNIL